MMSVLRRGLAPALVVVMALVPGAVRPAHASFIACTGGAWSLDSDTANGSFVRASAQWVPGGLSVTWRLSGHPGELPQGQHFIRYALIGYAGAGGGVPFVFAQYADRRGDAGWRVGAGFRTNYGLVTDGQENWVATWNSRSGVSIGPDSVTIFVPGRRMYWSENDVLQSAAWLGAVAQASNPGDNQTYSWAQSEHGTARSPVVATMVSRSGLAPEWTLTDWAPRDRVTAVFPAGHVFDNSPTQGPALCRPDPPAAPSPPATCDFSFESDGPAWFAGHIDVDGVALTTVQMAASGHGADGAVAMGYVSDSGLIDIGRVGSGSAVIARGSSPLLPPTEVDAPVETGVSNSFSAGGQEVFPETGPWWIVVLFAGSGSISFHASIKGAGISCGTQATGATVGYYRADAFAGSTAVHTSGMPQNLVAAGIGGRVTFPVRNRLISWFSGDPGVASVRSLWEKEPDGSTQRAGILAAEPLPPLDNVADSIIDTGGPGEYVFGIDAAAGAYPLGWEEVALLAADVTLP